MHRIKSILGDIAFVALTLIVVGAFVAAYWLLYQWLFP